MFETAQNSTAAAESYAQNKRTDNRVTERTAQNFIAALTELESGRDVGQLLALFADDCEIGNIVISKKFFGIKGARRFWTYYRNVFKDVCSIFRNELYYGNEANLEWTTEGKTKNGRKIKYEGVSLLRTKGGKITRFYAYFEPKILGRQIISKKEAVSRLEDKLNFVSK